MNIKKLNFLVFGAFLLALTALTSVDTNAQGRYTNRYSKRDVGNIIAKLENSSNVFTREFDSQMDKSSLNGTSEEDRLNDIVRNYDDSLDDLRREFDRNNTWWESRNDVQNVMSDAQRVNQMMNSLSFARKLERQWNNMRKDLNKLADTYDFPALDGTGFGGGGGGNVGNVPNWAVGTFYTRNPQTGGNITLTINSNGNVTINSDGSVSYATMNGDRLNNNGIEARVTRTNNGIRTTRTDNGERIDYQRQGY